jgi:hypothetical protein
LAAWGAPARPGLPPKGETGKGELQFLAAAGNLLARYASVRPPGSAPQVPSSTPKPEFPEILVDQQSEIDAMHLWLDKTTTATAKGEK